MEPQGSCVAGVPISLLGCIVQRFTCWLWVGGGGGGLGNGGEYVRDVVTVLCPALFVVEVVAGG